MAEIILAETASVSTPSLSKISLYADNTTNPQLKFVDDGGNDIQIVDSRNTVTLTNKTLTSPTITSPTISGLSGTYTPMLTNTTNIAASTANVTQWLRIGNTVVVGGVVDIDVTSASSNTLLGFSLPVPSALTQSYQVGGSGISNSGGNHVMGIYGDAINDRVIFQNITGWTTATNISICFTFTYSVI
jgi:hypothetical protein